MTVTNWTYFNPVRVISATGSSARLAEYIDFQRVALVTSPGFTRRGTVDRIRASLGDRLVAVVDDVKPNPDVRDVDSQASALRGLELDCIVALGGGSSIDTAKGLARLLTQAQEMTLAAHFRDGVALSAASRALPVVAVPTTAGTGAEVTPFGTIWDFDLRKKYSVTGADLYPVVAILDPELTLGLPKEVTVSSGLDAISHALESTWNRNASPITLGLATRSLQISMNALRKLHDEPRDLEARARMMEASLLAGLAISQTRTALAHSISYPLTTAFNMPHGVACSFTLPSLLRFNAEADDGRLQHLCAALDYRNPGALADALEGIFRSTGGSEVFWRHAIEKERVLELAGEMIHPARADNNMRPVSGSQLQELLHDAVDRI